MSGDEATRLIDEAIDYPETGRLVRIQVWTVPNSEAYPDGIRYRMHYGTTQGERIFRYDNSHAETKGHERRTADDVDEEYEFPGDYQALLARFREEVDDHEHD